MEELQETMMFPMAHWKDLILQPVAALAEQYPVSSGWMMHLFGLMHDNGKIILHCVASKQTLVEVIALNRLLGDGGIESFYSFNDYNLEWGCTEYFEVPSIRTC